MSGEPTLAVERLSIELPPGAERRHAIEEVSFSLESREILCLVGESGSGKSMTAHAVAGLLPDGVTASAGRILLDGTDLLRLDPQAMRRIRGRRIGMVFQEPMTALNPVMRVGDQIAETLRFHGVPDRGGERVLGLLAAVGLPDPRSLARTYPFRLSGGQRQRAMIAMALALDPGVLIADEPTTALDVTTQAQILDLLRDIQRRREMAILFITHDFGVVAEIAHRVAVMQEGRIVEIGASAEVLNRPRHPYTQRLIAAVPRLEPTPRPDVSAAPVLVEARGIEKTFSVGTGLFRPRRVVKAIDRAGFALRRGETLAIVGESGSGKSTLARAIMRLVRTDRGEVRLAGVEANLLALSPRALRPLRRRVQMIFQDPYASLNPRRRVGDIVAQGPLYHGVEPGKARRRVAELLDLVRLDPGAADRYPHEFSGGQRQRIAIARALALEPELLVADEPVSALDVSIQAQILELLGAIQRRMNLSMMFITHDLRVAAQIADTVAVMREGAIVETGPAAEVLFRPRHDYTKLLLASIPGRAWAAGRDASREVTA